MKKELNEIQLLVRAIAFATDKHSSQRRKDAEKSPYINHPIALVDVLANEGNVTDIETLCAAVLHDTIEDTETTAKEIRSIFGRKITAIVLELTDDKSLPKHVRKEKQIEHAPLCSPEAKLVKIADKICNLRNMLTAPPTDWSADRKKEYFDWAANVIEGLRGTHPRLETIFDIIYKEKDQITQSESMKTKTIGSLFKPEPQSWGLRGDPALWKDLAHVFREVPLPGTPELLKAMLESAFFSLTAHTIESNESFFVERYAHGGMSSGHVDPEFWKEKGFKMLLSRYNSIQ